MNRQATAAIWNKTFLKEAVSDVLPMFPFVPERFQFDEDGTMQIPGMVGDAPGKHTRVKSVSLNQQEKQLAIQVSNDFGDSALVFNVVDENRLILHTPTFVGGPARAVYSRVVDADDRAEYSVLEHF